MKRLFCIGMICIGAYTTAQQQQPPRRPPIEQRIKRLNDSLGKALTITATQKKTIDDAFTTFFTEADKITGNNPPPRPDATDEKSKQMHEQLRKAEKERDDKIEKILTADQFRKFRELERNLRPRPPGNMPPPPPPQRNN